MDIELPKAILAIGSLGTAAFGLVDAFKAFGGGVSNLGFGHLTTMLDRLFSGAKLTEGDKNDRKTPLAYVPWAI